MQIIPVLDLLNGSVVHGVGGDRSLYKPINSQICDSSEPLEVVRSILNFHPFEVFYIADLDSLQGIGCANSTIAELDGEYPEIEFWVDGGITNIADLERYPDSETIKPIIASESIHEIANFETLVGHLGSKRYILSLDHKNGELGASALFRESWRWPKDIIVMALDSVGKGQGPDHDLLGRYRAQSPNTSFFAAGGIRDIRDIETLMNNNTVGALVASALHNGQISQADLIKIASKKMPRTTGHS